MPADMHPPATPQAKPPATAPRQALPGPAWNPAFATGDAAIDDQARALLACCARLGPAAATEDTDPAALAADVEAFKAQVRALLAAEASRLAAADEALRDEQAAEAEEFEAFADEVVTAAHFDRAELHRFATVWSIGHLRAATQRLRAAAPATDGTGA